MKNEQIKVSIIVAVYNVEKYIRRCLDSLAAQTHKHIEVILVDDGSNDNSGIICDEYAYKDPRFKVIHKENGGVSKARQIGLDVATGDYVIHADPDDYVEQDMVETLLSKAIETNSDMVFCDFFLNDKYHSLGYKEGEDWLRKLVDVTIVCSCWNVLIKRSFIKEHNISFTPDWLCMSEDFLFLIRCVHAGATYTYLPKAFYHYYYNNSGSLSNSKSEKAIKSLCGTINELSTILPSYEYELFYNRKKYVLMRCLRGKLYRTVNTLYPEIHDKIHLYASNGGVEYWLSVALRTTPQRAYLKMRMSEIIAKVKKII